MNCSRLKDPTNGGVKSNEVRYNSTATYECLPGYELKEGDKTRMCLANGSWSGSSPICVRKYSYVCMYIRMYTIHICTYMYMYRGVATKCRVCNFESLRLNCVGSIILCFRQLRVNGVWLMHCMFVMCSKVILYGLIRSGWVLSYVYEVRRRSLGSVLPRRTAIALELMW